MQYEIEIKTLLGSKEKSDELLAEVTRRDPSTKLASEQHQLNHYFHNGDLTGLAKVMANYITPEQIAALGDIATRANHINVRTRQNEHGVFLIVKGSLDNVSAVHSHQRMEFEAPVQLTIDELDAMVIRSGWPLEAKWQASRKIYSTMGLTLDMVFAPGFGYFAEFEKVVSADEDRESAHQKLVDTMESLGVEELPNPRLERMFAYYNQHWNEYYGTDKVFVVE